MYDESWQKKINRARWVENEIRKWYVKNVGPATFPSRHTEKYDILCKAVGNVEVKEDLIACHSDNYAIECEDYDGEPSGLYVTEAGDFVLVDHEWVIFMKTESLKYVISHTQEKRLIAMGFDNEGKRSRGYLVPRSVILNSPYATLVKRWFLW